MKFGLKKHGKEVTFEPWYKWGVIFLYLEMLTAIGVSAYSLYMAFSGKGGFPGKH
ncbi:MAG: hypothetical protein BMS9Abin23_0248 [Thermodesulfobacteriota bacterium]|nr:MAG: hypothetical protein BMS9Abin23_0248 [Thermodesulfobacteriota bacterium]